MVFVAVSDEEVLGNTEAGVVIVMVGIYKLDNTAMK